MSYNTEALDTAVEVPAEVLSNPALLFLYYRIEQILGIKTGSDALVKLNEYLEYNCGASFIENPAAYEYLLTSREQIYIISKFLTVNETYFFRESAHFNLLSCLLPELTKLGRPLQICSAAVSIGCEAYSIAMLLDYHIKGGLNFDFSIDAFDINADAIETAKNARYTPNVFRPDGSSCKHILDSYLIQDGDEYIVSENIRRKVRFFPHNIMRGLDKQYDIIFFRNSLIYFSSKNRISVINNLAESLFHNGLLFIGISETSSVKHPLLASRNSSDVFYFQKTGTPYIYEQMDNYSAPAEQRKYADYKYIKQEKLPQEELPHEELHAENQIRHFQTQKNEITVSCAEINNILNIDDGRPNAEETLDALKNGNLSSFTGSALAASAIYYLNAQDFDNADAVISYLEKYNSGAFTRFLRGEYYFLSGISSEAEIYYNESSVKDKFFWPAFYRIAVLSADVNPTRYEYKIKKTIESIKHLKSLEPDAERNYECFMGGFSPDYFSRILERKLS
jgi:chemotaxis protein methyltransferase CheR